MEALVDTLVQAAKMAWEGEDIGHMHQEIDDAKQAILEHSSERIAGALLAKCNNCEPAEAAADILVDYMQIAAVEVPSAIIGYADYVSNDMLGDTCIFERKTLVELLDPRGNDPIYPSDAYIIGLMLKRYPYADFFICRQEQ